MKLPKDMREEGGNIIVDIHSIYFGIGFIKWVDNCAYISLLGTIFTYERVGCVSVAEFFNVRIYEHVGVCHRLFGFGYLTKGDV